MANGFEELLLEEMIEDEDDILFDDFSFIDSLIDEDEEALASEGSLFASEDEEELDSEEEEDIVE